MRRIKLKIEGLHCQSCVMIIKDSLEDIGVKEIRINQKTGDAEIEFDETKISLGKITSIIKKEGYSVSEG